MPSAFCRVEGLRPWRCEWALAGLRCRSCLPRFWMSGCPRCGGGLRSTRRPELLPDSVVRLGVRYSDGRTATNLPGAYWTAREEGPVFVTQSQADPPADLQGVEGAVALQWEVWPAPAPGELTVACAWPYADVPEQRVVFDETEMAAVIERSRRTAVTRRPRPAQTAPPPRSLAYTGPLGRHRLADPCGTASRSSTRLGRPGSSDRRGRTRRRLDQRLRRRLPTRIRGCPASRAGGRRVRMVRTRPGRLPADLPRLRAQPR